MAREYAAGPKKWHEFTWEHHGYTRPPILQRHGGLGMQQHLHKHSYLGSFLTVTTFSATSGVGSSIASCWGAEAETLSDAPSLFLCSSAAAAGGTEAALFDSLAFSATSSRPGIDANCVIFEQINEDNASTKESNKSCQAELFTLYVSALQPFSLRCTLKDVLTNSCTLYLNSCTLFTDTSPWPHVIAPVSVSTVATFPVVLR